MNAQLGSCAALALGADDAAPVRRFSSSGRAPIFDGMGHRPLFGHHAIRNRLAASWHAGRLPGSLLLVGRRGVGKQRIALWLGQLILCERAAAERLAEPCGSCQHCRYAGRGVHPDLHWFFPRPKLKNPDPPSDDIKADFEEAIAERMSADGLWPPSLGSEGIYLSTVKALLSQASLRPAMAARSVFVVGDAERMISQEGSDQAANAFLKLLEEPPSSTTLILTTSEPGALLPTVRSRVVTIRVPPLDRAAMTKFIEDDAVALRLAALSKKQDVGSEAVARAGGAPGELLAGASTDGAFAAAKRLLDAALAPPTPAGTIARVRAAAKLGSAGARGPFTDMLDALTVLLHQRTRQLVLAGHGPDARSTASAMMFVEDVKKRAQGNVSPQLLGASLLASLQRALRR